MKRTSQSESKLKITGKLDLNKQNKQSKDQQRRKGGIMLCDATYKAVLNSLFRLFIRCTNLNAMLTKKSFRS